MRQREKRWTSAAQTGRVIHQAASGWEKKPVSVRVPISPEGQQQEATRGAAAEVRGPLEVGQMGELGQSELARVNMVSAVGMSVERHIVGAEVDARERAPCPRN